MALHSRVIKHLANVEQVITSPTNEAKILFLQEIENSPELEKLLLDYDYGKGKLQNIQITRNSLIFAEKTKGKFKVTYDINEYSLCAAIDYTGSNYMDIQFSINEYTKELIISSEIRIERADEI